jgi:hypothetical protein
MLSLVLSFFVLFSYAQWSDDAEINNEIYASAGEETLPKIAADTEGNTFIAFHSNNSGNYDVLLAYVDKDGYPIWENVLVVSDHPQQSWISDFDMKMDNNGNAVIAFSDIRNGNPEIYAYKISPQGDFLWGSDGIACSGTPEPEYEPRLCVTDDNNVFITFIHPRETAPDQMVITAIDPEGNKLLGEGGLLYTPENEADYASPYVIAAGNDVIVVYSLSTGVFWSPDRLMYALKIDATGEELWTEPAVVSEALGITGYTLLEIIPDKQGGVFISWHDDRDSDMISSSFVQHINTTGDATLGEAGTEVATQPGYHRFDPKLVLSDSSQQEVMVFWRQTNSGQSEAGLFGQRLNSSGERVWEENGHEFIAIGSSFGLLHQVRQLNYEASETTTGQALLVYTKTGDGGGAFLHAMAVDHTAAPVWPVATSAISTNSSGLSNAVSTEMNQSQFVVAWQDSRENNGIFAQNIRNDGSIGILNTQIAANRHNEVIVYPNPATTSVTIRNGNFDQVIIYNMAGQIVKQQELTPHSDMYFQPYRSGLFFVTFVDGKRSITKKLIIVKLKQ